MRLTQYVHKCLEVILQPGDCVLDATAGNGFDSLKIAELIGQSGHLIAIDKQAIALNTTHKKLTEARLEADHEMILGDHAEILQKLSRPLGGALFNLGYLPGSDKSIISTPESTSAALNEIPRLLKEKGALFVTTYREHPGGAEESKCVQEWMMQQKARGWYVQKLEPPCAPDRLSPILWIAAPLALDLPRINLP